MKIKNRNKFVHQKEIAIHKQTLTKIKINRKKKRKIRIVVHLRIKLKINLKANHLQRVKASLK